MQIFQFFVFFLSLKPSPWNQISCKMHHHETENCWAVSTSWETACDGLIDYDALHDDMMTYSSKTCINAVVSEKYHV